LGVETPACGRSPGARDARRSCLWWGGQLGECWRPASISSPTLVKIRCPCPVAAPLGPGRLL